jgi:uncharacterized membrane protein (DUF485 family)
MPDDAGTSGNPRDSGPRDTEGLLRAIMRRQARLSIGVAAVFLVLVLGLPLVNAFVPGVAQARIGGFSATWLFLGVLFYPITWLLSGYFVRASEEVEQEAGTLGRGVSGGEEARGG